jgi:hypothetical protein
MNELTAAEISHLLVSYMNNTMAYHVTDTFLRQADDRGVREMLKFALEIADEEARGAERFLTTDNRSLPEPFTKADVDFEKKHYSDNFFILIKYSLAQDSLSVYGLSLSTSINSEVRDFYKKILNKTAQLVDMCTTLLIKHGLNQPMIDIPKQELHKIEQQSYLGKLIGKNRPLVAPEVLQLQTTFQSTEIFRLILQSFCQTKSPELSTHYERGVKMCTDQLSEIEHIFEKYELPRLRTFESEVYADLGAPFSDRLMLFKTSMITSANATKYGAAASATLRKDIGATFVKLAGQVLLYAEDTGNLLIKHRMLDEAPLIKRP